MSTQNIINVCLAIGTTFLIYQNTQLKDDIRYLRNNSLSDSEVKAIARDEAERVVEYCTASGYVDVQGSWAYYLTIDC